MSEFNSDKAEAAFNDGYCEGDINDHSGYEVEFQEGISQYVVDNTCRICGAVPSEQPKLGCSGCGTTNQQT